MSLNFIFHYLSQIFIDNLPMESNEASVRKLSEEKGGPVSNPPYRIEFLFLIFDAVDCGLIFFKFN